MPTQVTKTFYGVSNLAKFYQHLEGCINYVPKDGVFACDQIFTFARNLNFLQDQKFIKAVSSNIANLDELGPIWRYAVLTWAAKNALQIPGDFVECACYKGTSAKIICDYLDFPKINKQYYLYDLFEHDPTMPHHRLDDHGAGMYEKVKSRFSDMSNVRVTKGWVPEILHTIAPEQISFMHLDLNNDDAEIGALEFLFDRMAPGAILVLDDFGWLAYSKQQEREIPWFSERGYSVLELPTGQGLLIK